MFCSFRLPRRAAFATVILGLLIGACLPGFGQTGTNPLTIFQNYFVTGDYVVAGWVEGAPDGSGYAPGTISVPDTLQPVQFGVPASVPKGASIVAAYLYWATVEGNHSAFAGKSAYFNGYAVSGTVLGNPNAPTSWSAGGCSGSSQGSKTMRTYRADVRPYLPLDTDQASSTFGATVANGKFQVRLVDSGKNGHKAPFALGATLVIIYRVLSPALPLNAIVLYDGAFAPSNQERSFSQSMVGFYEPATDPHAKITHIVANGQANKNEQVYLNNTSQPLASLYGSLPPFPGIYGSWDNPTWVLSNYGYVKPTDTSETTLVVPSKANAGCVSWGATILSTTVQDSDGDGLLDTWENNQGYTDAVSGQWVALPDANPNRKDIFVELDYLTNLDGSAGPYLHSHLPKQAALDAVGAAFESQNIAVHFDLGPGIYQGDPYVITAGTGGNAIPEGQLLCTDGATLCAFPGQPAVGWKGGVAAIQTSAKLGNFQSGRTKSYHYILFGHSLGEPRSYWSTLGSRLSTPAIPQLVSIVDSGNTATITLQSPPGAIKPGDCPNAAIPGCSDASSDRIHITGALDQTSLNGTYFFNNPKTSKLVNNVYTTTLTITTAGVADGTYNSGNEPQLAVTYLGPTSSSGHADFRGGADSAVTFGLWGADDPANCQPDPSQSLTSGQVYCSNETGTVAEQTGTLLHELGHTLALTHGGTFYTDPNHPSVPTDGLNCAPNYLSAMNYLFQVRGFVDGGFDYSSQTLPPLNEASPNESLGIGTDILTGQPAAHITRWYAAPNAVDVQLQKAFGGRYAAAHCDGTPLLPNEPPAVRVDGTFTGALDWNNDLIVPDQVLPPGEDLNHNGVIGDRPFSGFNDWQSLDLQQIGARPSAFGASGGIDFAGGGINFAGGGIDFAGGGIDFAGGGLDFAGGGINFAGGGINFAGGGIDQNEETATSTADAPTDLACTVPLGIAPACISSEGFLEESERVPLSWKAPAFGQTRTYTVWRAVGSYGPSQVLQNLSKFTILKTLTGTPPSPSYIDIAVTNGTTYTYFVTDANKQGAQSGPSNLLVVEVDFESGEE